MWYLLKIWAQKHGTLYTSLAKGHANFPMQVTAHFCDLMSFTDLKALTNYNCECKWICDQCLCLSMCECLCMRMCVGQGVGVGVGLRVDEHVHGCTSHQSYCGPLLLPVIYISICFYI